MDNKHTIVYVMRHIDIGNNIDIPYKKVGITGAGNATLTNRLQQISNTKSPIQAQCIIAWSHSDANAIEGALHSLLEDNKVLGEWFLDKNDSLVERMKPIMKLLGADEITIKDEHDDYTQKVLKQESDTKTPLHQKVLGEITSLLDNPLRTSLKPQHGPTIFGDKSELTFYVNYRKSGAHALYIGRSKKVFKQLKTFLDTKGFESSTNEQETWISGISVQEIADIINYAEKEFKTHLQKDSKK